MRLGKTQNRSGSCRKEICQEVNPSSPVTQSVVCRCTNPSIPALLGDARNCRRLVPFLRCIQADSDGEAAGVAEMKTHERKRERVLMARQRHGSGEGEGVVTETRHCNSSGISNLPFVLKTKGHEN
jgi:hypothetical protein